MTPRLSTSVAKNRTRLPQDVLNLISQSFSENFQEFLEGKQVVSEGEVYLEELLLQIGFKEKGSIRPFNFECSMSYSVEKKDDAMEKIYAGLDAIQQMMESYVEAEGDIEFPTEWKSFDFNGQEVWLKTSTVNMNLEAQANALLGEEFVSETATGINEEFVDELFAKLRHLKH